MKPNLRFFAVAVLPTLAALLTSVPAHAQQPYPTEIESHLGLSYAPPCSLCHIKGNTGDGTVITPFGWAMRGRGLVADDKSSVDKGLDALLEAKSDVDGDGVGDVAELKAGTDPNTPNPVPLPNGEQPGYGCGGTAPNPNNRNEGYMAPLAVVLLFALRRLTGRAPRLSGDDR